MRNLTFLHISLMIIMLSGMGFCTRDAFEGPAARLLVKEHGAPDSKYVDNLNVYLGGYKGASVTIDVNTNYQWYIENSSLYSIPNWCSVTTNAGTVYSGMVTATTMTFTDKGDNVHPFVQMFTLVLCNSSDGSVQAKVHVYRNRASEVFEVKDYGTGKFIQKFIADKILEASYPYPPAYIPFMGSGSNGNGSKYYFIVNSSEPWKITVVPTHINANEPVASWMAAGLDGSAVTAQPDGNTIVLVCDQPGETVVWFTIAPNASDRYTRTADFEIAMDNSNTTTDMIKLSVKQQTAEAFLLLQDPGDYSVVSALQYESYNSTSPGNPITQTLIASSNRNWTASITYEGTDSGWLSIDPTSFNVDLETLQSTKNLNIMADANLGAARSATITFTGWYMLLGARVDDLEEKITISQDAFTPQVTVTTPVFLAGTLPHSQTLTFTTNFEVASVSGVDDVTTSGLTNVSSVNGIFTYDVVVGAGNNSTSSPVTKKFNIIPVESSYGTQTGDVGQDKKWEFSGIPSTYNFTKGTDLGFLGSIRPGSQNFYVNGYFGGYNWAITLTETGGDLAWLIVFGTNTSDNNWYTISNGGVLGARIYVQPRALPSRVMTWTAIFSVPYSYMTWTLTIRQTN